MYTHRYVIDLGGGALQRVGVREEIVERERVLAAQVVGLRGNRRVWVGYSLCIYIYIYI